jgi:hypothetical protein
MMTKIALAVALCGLLAGGCYTAGACGCFDHNRLDACLPHAGHIAAAPTIGSVPFICCYDLQRIMAHHAHVSAEACVAMLLCCMQATSQPAPASMSTGSP